MEESPGYRRNLARAFVRLYRPLAPAGRRRSRCDQVTARWWTRLDVTAYRHLGISLGVKALGVNDVLLLRTRGRCSGQVREVLVAYVELDEVPIICAANGGSDRAPAWFRNLQSGGPVEIERHGRRQAVVPVILEGDERERGFAAVYRAFPHVRLYLASTNRSFPVVRLETLEAQAEDPVAPCDLAVAVHGQVPVGASHRRIA
jgi:deazaflavin-dependent oxidoreductase (nitroreductase family)